MHIKPIKSTRNLPRNMFLWILLIMVLVLAQLGLSFAGAQQVQASSPQSVTSIEKTRTWTDPNNSAFSISFTTVQLYELMHQHLVTGCTQLVSQLIGRWWVMSMSM